MITYVFANFRQNLPAILKIINLTHRFSKTSLAVVVLLLSSVSSILAQEDPAREFIRNKVEQIRFSGGLTIGSTSIASVIVLPEFYEQRNFRLAWTNPETVDQLINVIEDIDNDGLNPDDYHQIELKLLRAQINLNDSPLPEVSANFDILLTDSLIRLGYHIIFGKVDPEALDADWNLSRDIYDQDPVQVIQKAIESNSVAELIEDNKPQHFFYKRLKSKLAEYRTIKKNGGWPVMPAGSALKKGMKDKRVIMLRKRLALTKDLQNDSLDSAVFDERLEQAVIRFQNRHWLDDDGVVGQNTFEALNVPVETRIDQIRVNLERLRWVLHEIKGDFIITDIAGYMVYYVQDDKITWTSRVQVGKPYRKTPVFKSAIKYLVFNPTWTVPPSILRKDILPAVKKDPDYLRKKNINVLDSNGKVIDQDSLDWSKYSAGNFPYILRQEPGPTNALGQIKFIFPNKHFVYLHDTPSKSLFGRTERAFSSGCIRVEKRFELAELLLNDKTKWNQEYILKELETKKTRTVFLPKPMPVMLLYWTTVFDENNNIRFKKDVYNRDRAVLNSLNGKFEFRKKPIISNTSY
ncbi:MAG: L,D-transpeptidase family protein [Thermodesulfovibrionia bacterium]|nr:L,D-transpeptidase family protein [Thermodesulfovibrionia bacterium]